MRRCSVLLLSLLASSAYVLGQAPQNHAVLPESASCITVELDSSDFCASIVNYPISSTLLHSSTASGVLSARHQPDHKKSSEYNGLSLLSDRAAAEYEILMAAHLEAADIAAEKPGGVRHAARAHGNADSFHVALPTQVSCEHLLRRYVCHNQYPRCFDEEPFVEPGKSVELHTCYSLCHDVRSVCSLSHRLDCTTHHLRLNPLYEAPSEHALRFDSHRLGLREGSDPFSEFWLVDCIDSPPATSKRVIHYLLYGGPAMYLAYTIAAFIIYLIILAFMGKSNGKRADKSATALLRVRRHRQARRALFDSSMRNLRKKYIKLQEIKTIMIDAQEADTIALASDSVMNEEEGGIPSPRATQTSIADRAAKLLQLNELLQSLETEIDFELRAMSESRLEEVREDYAAGRIPPSMNEEIIRQYIEGDHPKSLSVADIGSQADGEDVADAFTAEEQESLLASNESIKEFGKRRRNIAPDSSMDSQAPDSEDEGENKQHSQRRR